MQSQYYGFTEGEKMQRILLKLSGEALAGEKKHGFDEDTVRAVALQVKQLVDDGIQVGIVIGGGNFWRGRTSEHIDRTKADQIGMLATVMNCIYVSEIFRSVGMMTNILNPAAKKYDEVSIHEVIEKNLQVVDMTASILARDNKMPMWVFGLNEKDSIVNTVKGNFTGTKVTV